MNYVHNATTSNRTVDNKLKTKGRSTDREISEESQSSSILTSNFESRTKNEKLRIFSSFNCFMDFPSSIAEYVNDTFKNEFILSHEDVYAKDKEGEEIEKLPILLDVRVTCSYSQDCTTYFKFDKQYGIETSPERVKTVDNMFHCCTFVTNQTSETCKEAKSLVQKSLFRHSKNQVLLVSLKQ